MIIDFFKMQGQGNDYIYIDQTVDQYPDLNPEKLAITICKRHFSIGADGVVLISKSSQADIKMNMFNADGSKGLACGTAFRCLTNYVHMNTNKTVVTIETEKNIITGYIPSPENPFFTRVNMGKPEFRDNNTYKIEGYSGRLVNIGNMHFVSFVEEFNTDMLNEFGPKISNNKELPEKVNVNFARIISDDQLELWFWDLGSGPTLSCGSGTCAVVFSAIKTMNLSTNVKAIVPGGNLAVEYQKENIFLSGTVELSFSGKIQV